MAQAPVFLLLTYYFPDTHAQEACNKRLENNPGVYDVFPPLVTFIAYFSKHATLVTPEVVSSHCKKHLEEIGAVIFHPTKE